ncbi:acyl-CoA dehydrogenase family protein [Peribacillus frigoritolerans]|nr:acyl-CoA dehydrogenase family protein [Peribacillus frigoritolerans]
MGVRASNTCEIILDNVRVPKEKFIQEIPDKGFKQFLFTLDGGRISIAALAVGIAQAAFDRALAFFKRAHSIR